MLLSEFPIEKIHVGTRVWNAKKTQQGSVAGIRPKEWDGVIDDDYVIYVKWDSGLQSEFWHFWGDRIEVVDD
jgi:hypothetical protein